MLQLYNIFVLDYFDLKASWVRGENVFRKGEALKTLLIGEKGHTIYTLELGDNFLGEFN